MPETLDTLPLRTIGLGELMGLDGLRNRSDLVDLEEEAVAGFFVHCHLDPLGVGHGQVLFETYFYYVKT